MRFIICPNMTEDRSTRLIILVTVYGSALGSLPVIVHMINATRPSHWQEAQHMGFWPTLLFGSIGTLGAFLLVRPLLQRFLKRSADRYGLFLWICMAIIFALFVIGKPFISSAVCPMEIEFYKRVFRFCV